MFSYNPADMVQVGIESGILVGRCICYWVSGTSIALFPKLFIHLILSRIFRLKPFDMALLGIALSWLSDGLGHHATQVPRASLARAPKYYFAAAFMYELSISLPKFSAIFFYKRVFRTNSKAFGTTLWLVGGLNSAWIIFSILSDIFQCSPVKKAWLPQTPGHCADGYKIALASASMNVINDLIIMVTPLPIIWKLHTGRLRKLTLSGIFICAYWYGRRLININCCTRSPMTAKAF